MEKEMFLRKYHKDAEVIKDNTESIKGIPQSWTDVLCDSSVEGIKEKIIDQWRKYAYPMLSNTIMYMEENLEKVELIRYSGKYSLLYSIKMPNGNIAYYEGGNPEERKMSSDLRQQWDAFPLKVKSFYENLHNGFFYYASGSMGIVPVEDIVFLGEEDWGILDELKEPLRVHLDNTFGIFSSGMGGYVAVDTLDCTDDKATLWYTNRQPRYNINFWDVVDEWIVIGFQN